MRFKFSLRGVFSDFAESRGISTRLLILFIVLFAMAVTLAPPTQHYFAQRAQISALEASVESNKKKLIVILATPDKPTTIARMGGGII